jgi:hypothetical protein
MIDTTTETIVTFAAAARKLPALRNNRPVNPATLWRWSAVGCLGRDRQRVKLETVRIGGSTCTSIEALQRFFARLSRDRDDSAGEQENPRATSKGHAQAVKSLEVAGIA